MGSGGGGLELVCGRPTLALGSAVVHQAKQLHQGWPRNTGGGKSQRLVAIITVLVKTPNLGKVGNTAKYKILKLFWLKYFVKFLQI